MTIVNLLVLLANLGVLGLNLKLYTEILKDRKIDTRLPIQPPRGREESM